MENSKKKLRLDELQVESFVTGTVSNPDTIRGGWTSSCTDGKICSGATMCNVYYCRTEKDCTILC